MDMFGWFKKKKEVLPQSAPPVAEAKAAVEETVNVAGMEAPAPAAEPAAAVTVAPAEASSPVDEVTKVESVRPLMAAPATPSEPTGVTSQAVKVSEGIAFVSRAKLAAVQAKPPIKGMSAIEIRARKRRPAEITRVQAHGRRVVATISGRPYPFTLRRDGSYRLDGAPEGAGPRLLLGE